MFVILSVAKNLLFVVQRKSKSRSFAALRMTAV